MLDVQKIFPPGYLSYPPGKDRTLKWVFQNHWRGPKSVHADMRFENDGFLIGFTMAVQQPDINATGLDDVETASVQRAANYTKDHPGKFKINPNTGEFAQRRTRAGVERATSITSFPKSQQPKEWLKVEGVVDPGGIGASANLPAVFHILDSGEYTPGVRKASAWEVFIESSKNGLFKGRYFWRPLKLTKKNDVVKLELIDSESGDELIDVDLIKQLEDALKDIDIEEVFWWTTKRGVQLRIEKLREWSRATTVIGRAYREELHQVRDLVKQRVLPPSEGQDIPGVTLLMIRPISQVPNVMEKSSREDRPWIPPRGWSALPDALQKKVPNNLRYWTKSGEKERMKLRDELYELWKEDGLIGELEKGEVDKDVEKRGGTAFTYWGSKKWLASRIGKKLPQHRVYIEPFAGSAAMLLGKERSKIEILSDRDPEVVDALQLARDLNQKDFDWIIGNIRPRMKSDLLKLWEFAESKDNRKRLAGLMYRMFCRLGNRKEGSSRNPSDSYWSACDGKLFGASALPHVSERLKGVKIVRGLWQDVVAKYDAKDTLIYFDPPYPKGVRNAQGSDFRYGGGFEVDQLKELADWTRKASGKIIVSINGDIVHRRMFDHMNAHRVRINRATEYMTRETGRTAATEFVMTNFQDEKVFKGLCEDDEFVEVDKQTGKFRLLRRFWLVRPQVRETPKEFFELYQDFGKRTVRLLRLEANPIDSAQTFGTFDVEVARRLMERTGTFASDDIEPPGPKKVGTVTIEEIDSGTANLISDDPKKKEFKLGGKKLSGSFTMQDEGGDVWSLSKNLVKMLHVDLPDDAPGFDADIINAEERIVKLDDGTEKEERVFWCEVHRAYYVDLQGDFMKPMTLRHAAWNFLEKYRNIKLMHEKKANVSVVESFVTWGSTPIGVQSVPGDVWIVALRCHDDKIWRDVKSGKYRGLSLGGKARRRQMALSFAP